MHVKFSKEKFRLASEIRSIDYYDIFILLNSFDNQKD